MYSYICIIYEFTYITRGLRANVAQQRSTQETSTVVHFMSYYYSNSYPVRQPYIRSQPSKTHITESKSQTPILLLSYVDQHQIKFEITYSPRRNACQFDSFLDDLHHVFVVQNVFPTHPLRIVLDGRAPHQRSVDQSELF